MIIQYHKIALAAAFGLAMAFTLSCSSGGDDTPPNGGGDNSNSGGGTSSLGGTDNSSSSVGGTSSSSGGGKGALFNENSQIYNEDDTSYTGSGTLTSTFRSGNINVGSVTAGIVNLQLPSLQDEDLGDFSNDSPRSSCTSYPENIKFTSGDFVLTNNNGNRGYLQALYYDGQIAGGIIYYYFSKAGRITCTNYSEDVYNGVVEARYNTITNIDAKVGWNKIYFRAYPKDGVRIVERSTNDILTKEVKWIFSPLVEH